MYVKSLISITIVIMTIMRFAEGGSPCPPRENIYPCFCTDVSLSKKQSFTIVACRHLANTNSLSGIFDVLRQMHIDRFILYDSFWNTDDHVNKKMPTNWFSLLRIKDLQIIDSELSHDIACDGMTGCPNNVPTHLRIVNSSSTDQFVTVCKTSNLEFSWINCMGRLEHFEFVKNKLKAISKEFFLLPMQQLLFANFSYNEINNVDLGAFENLPKLATLDLSHNMIRNLKNGLFGKQAVLTYLDLSWNFITQLSPDIFSFTPHLKYFGAKNNRISKLPYDYWKGLSQEIRTLDLIGNPVECDCHVIWLNCTLKVHVNVIGYCENEEYEETPLRRVAKYMSERCVDGVLMIRDNTTKRNACLDGTWQKSSMIPIHLEAREPAILLTKDEEIDNNLPKMPKVIGERPRKTRSRNSRP